MSMELSIRFVLSWLSAPRMIVDPGSLFYTLNFSLFIFHFSFIYNCHCFTETLFTIVSGMLQRLLFR